MAASTTWARSSARLGLAGLIQHSTVTNGTLTADGGTLFIGGDFILSNVAIVIEDRGIAEFGDALDQGITFNGDGTLVLDQAPGEGATVTNFAANGANDVLDFTNIAWADGPTPSWLENEQQTAGSLTITYQTVDGNIRRATRKASLSTAITPRTGSRC